MTADRGSGSGRGCGQVLEHRDAGPRLPGAAPSWGWDERRAEQMPRTLRAVAFATT